MAGIAAELKKKIQNTYSSFIKGKNFKARVPQKQMIADIANTINDSLENEQLQPITIEAGTGTGKTIAYLIATLPFAIKNDLTLIVSTSTINLQNQLINKDLPDLKQFSDLDFDFSLIKGRGRYVCNMRLNNILTDHLDNTLTLFADETSFSNQQLKLYNEMNRALLDNSWDGDIDNWAETIDNRDWRQLTVDGKQCLGRKCNYYKDCRFQSARENVKTADCVIANHDIVLADLRLGSGKLLPAVSDSILILDEAHQFNEKCRKQFTNSLNTTSSETVLNNAIKNWNFYLQQNWRDAPHSSIESLIENSELLRQFWQQLSSFSEQLDFADGYYRFDNNQIPEQLITAFSEINDIYDNFISDLGDLVKYFEKENEQIITEKRTNYQNSNALILGIFENHIELIRYFLNNTSDTARWITVTENDSIIYMAAPLVVGALLEELLWDKAKAVVLTSASLRTLGNFDYLKNQLFFPDGSIYKTLPSIINYKKQAKLFLFKSGCNPKIKEEHNASIVFYIENIMDINAGNLVLFTQNNQMLDILRLLPKVWRNRILCQNTLSKDKIIAEHKQAIDKGKGSTIFGLASFSEGVDLPNAYCTHLLIAKIPFNMPKSPYEESIQQMLLDNDENPFSQYSMPIASMKLLQATGRLLRNETDTGKIAICDDRLTTKFYGKKLIANLPSFDIHTFESMQQLKG